MRVIKFRAWALSAAGETMRMLSPALVDKDFADMVGDESFILMQFTGLQDIDGEDIYEGDLLEIKHRIGNNLMCREKPSPVFFEEGCFQVKLRSENRNMFLLEVAHDEGVIGSHACKVVGNVCQNPELLERIKK